MRETPIGIGQRRPNGARRPRRTPSWGRLCGAPHRSLARSSRNPGQPKLCASETCRARCRGCKISQILLALCFSAVSYYDDAVSEVEPTRRLCDIARSGFK
jgi:hypothetical protein